MFLPIYRPISMVAIFLTLAFSHAHAASPATASRITRVSPAAVGNGIHDDRIPLQAAINAAPPGATLLLDANKIYKISAALTIDKSITLDLNGSALSQVNGGASPTNRCLYIASRLGSPKVFDQALAPGTTTFACPVSPATLPPGATVFCKLGRHPADSHEPDWSGFLRILANDGHTLTFETPLSYAINGTCHELFIPQSIAENITITNGRLESGKNSTSLCAEFGRNITLSKLTTENNGIIIDHLTGCIVRDLVIHTSFHNQVAIGGWFLSHATCSGITWVPDKKDPTSTATFMSLEHWSQDVRVDDLTVTATREFSLASFQLECRASFGTVELNGGSPSLGPSGGISINELRLNAPDVGYFDFSRVRSLVLNGKRFPEPKRIELSIPLGLIARPNGFELPAGLYRRLNGQAIGDIKGPVYLHNGTDKAVDIVPSLVNGDWRLIQHGSYSGTGFGGGNANSLANLQRRLSGSPTSGKQLDLMIDYFPAP